MVFTTALFKQIFNFQGGFAPGELGSLPYRTVTIRDAISDLPYIDYESMSLEMPYEGNEMSHYVCFLREYCNRDNVLTEHVCNNVSLLVKKRIQLIPEGGDWRDLPNVPLKLEDGSITDTLQYIYR